MPEKKETSNLTKYLVAGVVVIYIGVNAVVDVRRVDILTENNQALECLIDQLTEHRTNNRAAHQADATHHHYEYEVGPDNLPKETDKVDDKVCDQWLTRPEPTENNSLFGG